MVSADDVAATLRFLIPGFVALRVFYWFGLKTKRTDLELTLWSLLAAGIIDAIANLAHPGDGTARLLLATSIAVAVGGFSSAAWIQASTRWPALATDAAPSAWERVLTEPHWVNVWTTKDEIIFGTIRIVGLAVETDDPDIYLEEPEWVNATTGARTPIEGTHGVIIKRSDIRLVQVLAPGPPTPS